jgi:hypothetical protein
MREHRPSESRRKQTTTTRTHLYFYISTRLSILRYYTTLITLKPSPYHSLFSSPVPLSRVARPLLSSFSRSTRRRPLYSSMKVFVSSRGWCSHHHRSILSSRRPLSTGRASTPSLDETSKTRRLRLQSKTSTRVRVFASSLCSRISDFSYLFFTFGEASELEIRHFFYSLKSHSFFSCRGDSERESASKKAPHASERASDREHASAVFFRKGSSRREREREVQRDVSRGGELERSDVFPRATRKERRSGTETFRRENERRDHGED